MAKEVLEKLSKQALYFSVVENILRLKKLIQICAPFLISVGGNKGEKSEIKISFSNCSNVTFLRSEMISVPSPSPLGRKL